MALISKTNPFSTVFDYGSGDQIITGTYGLVFLGDGSDTVTTSDYSTVTAGNGNDAIVTGNYSNVIVGSGNNVAVLGNYSSFHAGFGNNIVYAGTSGDTVSFLGGTNLVIVTDTAPTCARDLFIGGIGTDTLQLNMTTSQWLQAATQADVKGFIASTAQWGAHFYNFQSVGINTISFEQLNLVIDGYAVSTTHDNAPIITSATAAGGVTQTALATPGANALTDSVSGSIAFRDFDLTDTHRTVVVPVGTNYIGTLSASVQTDSTGTTSGSVAWTYSVSNSAIAFLGAGQTLTQNYAVYVTDSQGVATGQNVTITITGTNDAAIIGTPTATDVTEDVAVNGYGYLVTTGTIAVSDLDQNQSGFQTTVTPASGNLGVLSLAANGAYTYYVNDAFVQYLGAGDTKVDTFTIAALDGTTKTVSFNIHGTNDAAIIGNPTSADVTEDVAVNGWGYLVTTGTIAVSDADQNQSSFQTTVTPASGNLGVLSLAANGAYTYYVNDAFVQYLGAGDTKVDTFTIAALDGTTKTVSFNIHGTNDAAIIGTPTNAFVTEDTNVSNGFLIASGTIAISDVDQGQAGFQQLLQNTYDGVAVRINGGPGNLGGLNLRPDGGYDYAVANTAVQYLAAGQTKTDTFTITSIDGTTKQVSFTITGTNDAPVLSSDTMINHATVKTAGTTTTDTASVTLAFTDVDVTDKHTVGDVLTSATTSRGTVIPTSSLTALANALSLSEIDSTGSGTGSVKASFSLPDTLAVFLGAGETLTVTYNITVTDNFGLSSTKPVTFTTTGVAGTAISASNTTIYIGAPGDTLTGSNNVVYLPDGLSLTLNGTGDTISGNNEAITASNVAIVLNGSGDTVSGSGDVLTLVAGSSLTLTGSGDTVNGNSVGIIANNAAITLTGSGDGVIGTGDAVTLANGSVVTDFGNGNTFNGNNELIYASYTSLSVTGSGDTINGFADTLTLANGSSVTATGPYDTVMSNGGTINLGSGSDTIVGANNNIILANGSNVTLLGTKDTVTGNAEAVTASNVAITLAGSGDTVTGSGDALTLANGSSVTLLGTGDTVTGNNEAVTASNVAITLAGTGDTVTGSGDTLSLANGSNVTLLGTKDTVTGNAEAVTASNVAITLAGSGDTVTGSGDALTLATGSSVTLLGTGDTVTGSNEAVTASNVAITLAGSGDSVLGSGDALTLANGSSVTLLGTGDTVTGNSEAVTASNIAITLAGSGDTVTGSGDALTLGNGSSFTLLGTGDTVTGNNEAVTASNVAITLAGSGDSVLGSGDALTLANGSSVTLLGTGDTVTGSNEAVTASNVAITLAGSGDSVTGSGDALTLANGSSVTLLGTKDTVTGNGEAVTASNVAITLTGTGDTVTGSGDTLSLANGSSVTLLGTGDTVTGNNEAVTASNVAITLAGSGDTVTGSGDSLTLANGSSVTLLGTGDTVTGNNEAVTASNVAITLAGSGDTVTGSGDTLSLANGSNVTLLGTGDTVTGSNEAVTASNVAITLAGSGDTVTGSGDALTLATGSSVTLLGTGDTVTGSNEAVTASNIAITLAGSGDSVLGSGDALTLANGSSVTLLGTGDTVTGSNEAVTASNVAITLAGSGDSVLGSGDALTLANGSSVTLLGTGDTVTGSNEAVTASNVAITLAGSGDSVLGSGDALTLANGSSVTLLGTGDTVTGSNEAVTASNVAITLAGSGDTVTGSGDALTLGNGSSVTLLGTGDTVTGNGEAVTASNVAITLAGSGDTVTGSGDALTLANGSSVTLLGTGDTVNGNGEVVTASNVAIALNGFGDVVSGSGDTLTLKDGSSTTLLGTGDTVTGNNEAVTASNVAINIAGTGDTITGTGDTFSLGNGSSVTLLGTGDTVNGINEAVTASKVAITLAGSGDTVTGSGDALTLANNSSVTLGGNGDSVAGNNENIILVPGSTVALLGTGDTINGESEATFTAPFDLAQAGSTTNGGTIEITGTTNDAPGDTITLYSGTSVVGTGLVGAGGNFDIETSAIFADGTYSLTATDTSMDGLRTSASSAPVLATVASTAPVGLAQQGPSSNDGTIEITGTGDATGDTITLYNGATEVGSGTAGPGGAFDIITTTTFADGTVAITATDTSADGTQTSAQSGAVNAIVASTAPVDLIQQGPSSNGGMIEITGTGDAAGDTITLYNGTTVVGSGMAGPDGTFDITTMATFADGSYSLTATDTSADGTQTSAQSDGVDAIVASTAPAGLMQRGTSSNGGTIEITGTGDAAGDTITFYNGTMVVGSGTAGAGGTFDITTTATFADGSYNLTATDTSADGTVTSAPSSSLVDLASFNGANGANPYGALITDSAGDLFGTTVAGGANGDGTVFEIAKGSGSITTLATFDDSNGSNPYGGLIADNAGNLYGTTQHGGTNGVGTVFEIAAGSGTITTLASFDNANGADPSAPLIADSAGDLFGTTIFGGDYGAGSVFEITAGSGVITTLASFDGDDGEQLLGGLTIDGAGNLYGTTPFGGDYGDGTVFEIAVGSGVVTTLATFDRTNGFLAESALIADGAGNLFGTTVLGGASDKGTVFEVAAGSGIVTVLASFDGTNGANPYGAPIADGAGNFYGTTQNGGANGDGTVFEIAKGSGTITTLADLTSASGTNPYAGLTMDAAGTLFGVGTGGGSSNDGAVFEVVAADAVVTATAPTGLAQKGTASNGGTIEITGTGDAPGDTITLYNGGTAVGSGKVVTNGTFDVITSSTFADGSYNLTATDTSADGTQLSAMSTAVAAVVAATAPSGLAQTGTSSSGGTIEITGTGDAINDLITLYNGTAVVGTGTAGLGGTFDIVTTARFADGTLAITATDKSVDGTQASAPSPALNAIVGATAPTGLAQKGAASNGGTIEVTGVTSDAVGDAITLYNGTTVVGAGKVVSGGTFDIITTATFADGTIAITATDTSADGTQTSAKSAVLNAAVAATAPTNLAQKGATISGGTIEVTGTTSDAIGDTITLYNGTTAVGTGKVVAGGTFDIVTSSTFADGTVALTATDTSADGTQISAKSTGVNAIVGATAPTGLAKKGTTTNGGTIEVTGVTSDAVGDAITLYNGTTAVGSGKVLAGGTFDIVTSSTFADGTVALTATDTSADGTQISASSSPVNAIVGATAPTGLAQMGAATNGGTIEVTGVTSDAVGDAITLYNGTTVVGSGKVVNGGTFDIVTSSTFADGTVAITATDTSADGTQISAKSSALNAIVAATAPTGLAQKSATTNGGTIEVTGATSDAVGDTVTLYNGTTAVGTGKVVTGGTFDIITTATFADGTVAITAMDTSADTTQISAKSPAVNAIVAATVPAGLAQKGTSSNGGTIEITGTGDAVNDTITLYNGTTVVGTGKAGAGGTFDIVTSATFADNTVAITAADSSADGTQTSAKSAAVNAAVAATAPAGLTQKGTASNRGTLEVTGTANDAVGNTITLYNGKTVVGSGKVVAGGTFDIITTATFADGTVALTATDTSADATQISAKSSPLNATVAATAPTGLAQKGTASNGGTVEITGTGDAAGDKITLYNGATIVGSGTAGTGGAFDIVTSATFTDGTYHLTATDTSADGSVTSAMSSPASSTSLNTLTSFTGTGTNGANPRAGLVTDAAGDLFGTTYYGGSTNAGTVFEIKDTNGVYATAPTTLINFSFSGTIGANPQSGLIVDAAGDLFGDTADGGTYNDGTIFEIKDTNGVYDTAPTTFYNFTRSSDGANAQGGVVADAAGDLFGITSFSGATDNGTVFELKDTNGVYASTPTTLFSFNGTNGGVSLGDLILDASGDLFGTTTRGGTSNTGTVFEVKDTNGVYASAPTTLVSFTGGNGKSPQGSLIADAAGDLFGTTSAGGANNDGTVFEIAKNADGTYASAATLFSFNGTNGATSQGSLIADTAGNLYGTTAAGGQYGDGTIFEVVKNANGSFATTPTVLESFNGTNGSTPQGALLLEAGTLLGTTKNGGANNDGTVFAFTTQTTLVTATAPTGLAQKGSASNGGTIEITGTGDAAGDTITLYNGTTAVGSGTAGTGGAFDITSSAAFATGSYALTATDTSVDGTITSANSTATSATSSASVLSGNANHLLFAGPSADTFVFQPGTGQDQVVNFATSGANHDVLDLSAYHFASLAAVIANAATSASGSATIQLNTNDSVTLTNVAASSLSGHPELFKL